MANKRVITGRETSMSIMDTSGSTERFTAISGRRVRCGELSTGVCSLYLMALAGDSFSGVGTRSQIPVK